MIVLKEDRSFQLENIFSQSADRRNKINIEKFFKPLTEYKMKDYWEVSAVYTKEYLTTRTNQ